MKLPTHLAKPFFIANDNSICLSMPAKFKRDSLCSSGAKSRLAFELSFSQLIHLIGHYLEYFKQHHIGWVLLQIVQKIVQNKKSSLISEGWQSLNHPGQTPTNHPESSPNQEPTSIRQSPAPSKKSEARDARFFSPQQSHQTSSNWSGKKGPVIDPVRKSHFLLFYYPFTTSKSAMRAPSKQVFESLIKMTSDGFSQIQWAAANQDQYTNSSSDGPL